MSPGERELEMNGDEVSGAVREQLYTTESLLGGWNRSSILSYAQTLDAQTFLKAWGEGIRVPQSDETARARALHDHAITRALSRTVSGRRVVAFMGDHKLSRDSDAYRLVAECSQRLTCEGYLVVSGGGPGAMETAHLGARLAQSSAATLNEALKILNTVPTFPKYTGKEFVTTDESFNERLLAAVQGWRSLRGGKCWHGSRPPLARCRRSSRMLPKTTTPPLMTHVVP